MSDRSSYILVAAFVTTSVTVAYTGEFGMQSPYPPSDVITDIDWAPESEIVRLAWGSDNWPLTWADDNRIYTAYGDGSGFSGHGDGRPVSSDSGRRLSLGIAVVDGSPGDPHGQNIDSATAEQFGDGVEGKKASGMLFVSGTLYMWVRNANTLGEGCQLAWSNDYAETWEWASWKFHHLGYCAFANFGKANAWNEDDYAYIYSPDGPSAYRGADGLALLRVPVNEISREAAYEYFTGKSDDAATQWSAAFEERENVFVLQDGVNRLDVTYNRPLNRYLLTMRNEARAGGRDYFGIFDAPDPWGPWSTVFFAEEYGAWTRLARNVTDPWGESQHVPAKWISEDGLTINVVFSGADSFSVRRAVLSTAL